MAQAAKKKDTPAPKPETKEPLLDKPIEKAPALTASRFGLANEYRNVWKATCEMGTTPEQIMDQSYWANLGMSLRPGDRIVVMPDNMAWELHLRVLGAGNLYAHVVKLAFYNLEPMTAPIKLPSIYTVNFAGSHHKWRVLRDGQPLKDGFETENLARKWAANHEAAVNR
jgi:hypothetical protein